MSPGADPRLRAELARTLRDEIGAGALYARLAPATRDPELARVVSGLAEESPRLIEGTRAVVVLLGLRAREWSVHRPIAGQCLVLVARLGGLQLALRICQESESILARRHQEFARYLGACGAHAAARGCTELAARKAARARALAPWVPR